MADVLDRPSTLLLVVNDKLLIVHLLKGHLSAERPTQHQRGESQHW